MAGRSGVPSLGHTARMAGGMNRSSQYGTMADRVIGGRGADRPAAEIPLRHCWVTDSNGRLPGLLLEWRQAEGEWRGRVVHPVQEDGAWVIVEEWLPAELLDPVAETQ
jgi:hypothetical protein